MPKTKPVSRSYAIQFRAVAFGLALMVSAHGHTADTTTVSDVSGDGRADVATFTDTDGGIDVTVYSSRNGRELSTLTFLDSRYQGIALERVVEMPATGRPALAMLATRTNNNRHVVQVRDLGSGDLIADYRVLNSLWAMVDLAVIDDLDGDGVFDDPAVAVLARLPRSGKILVQIIRLSDGIVLANRAYLNRLWTPVAIAAAHRPGMPTTLAILAILPSSNKMLIESRFVGNGVLQRRSRVLNRLWIGQDLATLADLNGDGDLSDPAWLVLARNPNSGANVVETLDVGSGTSAGLQFVLNRLWGASRLAVAADVNGNSQEELVVSAARPESGNRIIGVSDFDTGETLRNIFPPALPPHKPPGQSFQDRAQTVLTGETYDPSEVSTDVDGKEVIRTRLVVYLNANARVDEVDEFLVAHNASITASLAGSRSMGIRIPDPGTIDALDTLITTMEAEPFVDAVLKEYVLLPLELPENITEGFSLDYDFISHHLAVDGAAAWNAREAIQSAPNVMLLDYFGDGTAQLEAYLDATLSGEVASNNPDDHGYFVAGVIAGIFGGGSMEPDLVTGLIPGPINLFTQDVQSGLQLHQYNVALAQTASSMSGTIVLNTSVGIRCRCASSSRLEPCNTLEDANDSAVVWANLVRAVGLESKLLHVTAAGNRQRVCDEPAGYDLRDAETSSPYNGAALLTDLTDADGNDVFPLTNTLVVENLMRNEAVDYTQTPARVACLNENSFVGGHIGGIGHNVTSLTRSGTTVASGTSAAAPQVASLAAYLLAIKPELSPQDLMDILLDTSEAPGLDGAVECSDFPAPAPAINAYSAVLALDQAAALNGSPGDAPVRLAILDVVDGSGSEGSNGNFDERDLEYFINKIDEGTAEIETGSRPVKHSRIDLNADGYDGGAGFTKRFNLDIDYPPTYTTVTQTIEQEQVEFDEAALTDNEILCYYAYSGLYTGSSDVRRTLMAPRCERGIMAVYVSYYRSQVAVLPSGRVCEQTSAELNEERETTSQRPVDTNSDPFEQRPAGHYWRPGDSDVEINVRTVAGDRIYMTGGDAFNPVCSPQTFSTETEFNSTLQHADDGNRLNIDVNSRADAECKPDLVGGILECSSANTRAEWIADFDYAFQTALNLTLVMQLNCSAISNRVVSDPSTPNPASIGNQTLAYSVLRFDHTGQRIVTGRQARFFSCGEAGVVDVVDEINLTAPAAAGTTDNLILRVSGVQLITAPYITGVDTEQGPVTISSSMNGYVEVRPGT